MNPFECQFEEETLAAAVSGRRPDAALQAHIEVCSICGDLARLAPEFDEASARLRSQIRVPDASRVWWMAQLRARHEAAHEAGRPITAAQIIAFTCSITLLGACFGATSSWFQAMLARLADSLSAEPFRNALAFAASLVSGHLLLAAVAAGAVLAIPAVVLLAVSRE